MGYYTNYKFSNLSSGITEDEIEEELYKINGYNNHFAEHKWYEHEDDLKKVSLKFPDAIIVVDGVGEEPDDIWRKWFYNGHMKCAQAKIIFEEPTIWS